MPAGVRYLEKSLRRELALVQTQSFAPRLLKELALYALCMCVQCEVRGTR